MRILHTADWHLGQTFYDNDRTLEHEFFLNWLLEVIDREQVDAVLVSGDVYDNSNPSNKAIGMLYGFIQRVSRDFPEVQLIFTGGNHDSALRLEQPIPLLEDTNVRIVGCSKMNADKTIRYEDLIVRLQGKNGDNDVLCMAVPFLRLGDYPLTDAGTYDYEVGVKAYYKACFEAAKKQAIAGEPIIAMGHLHARGIKLDARDTAERDIIGGIEMLSASDFPAELTYVALGHIHKAQRVGGLDHVRYCGSPIPLSFSEKDYKHQVLLVTISDKLEEVKSIEIPKTTQLIQVPNKPLPFDLVMQALDDLQVKLQDETITTFVEVLVDVTQMTPNFIELIKEKFNFIQGKLVKITPAKLLDTQIEESDEPGFEYLDQVKPMDFLTRILKQKNDGEVKESYAKKLNEIINQLTEE